MRHKPAWLHLPFFRKAPATRHEPVRQRTCNMTRQAGNRALYIKETIALGCEFIQLHQRDGYENIEEEVALLHANGVTVNWFGANEVELMQLLNRAGVDFVLTDKLELAMKSIGK